MIEILIVFLSDKLHILIALVATMYFLLVARQKKKKLILLSAIALPLSYVIGKVVGLVIETTRPFAELGITPLVSHIADNGFPSEHTLYALVIAGVIFCVHKKLGAVLVLLSLLVGTGRVLALIHNPIDIVGSISIAILVIYVACRVVRRFFV